MITSLPTKRRPISAIKVINISKRFTHKMAAKASWHRNYATVTLCICNCTQNPCWWRFCLVMGDSQWCLDVGGSRQVGCDVRCGQSLCDGNALSHLNCTQCIFKFCFNRAMLCICGNSHGPVSVRPSQVGVLSKWLNESSWFLACELPSTRPALC